MPGRKKMVESEATRRAAQKRRLVMPLILKGVGDPKLHHLSPVQLLKVRVDDSYQRPKHRNDILKLIHVALGGGFIPAMTLVERANGERMCVDGQQRLLAQLEAGVAAWALIHPVDNIESEKALFLVSNDSRRLDANIIIADSATEVAELIRRHHTTQGSQLYDLVDFGKGEGRWSAFTLLRCATKVLGAPSKSMAGVHDMLGAVDAHMRQHAQGRERVEAVWSLLSSVYDHTRRLSHLPATALAHVAGERWRDRVIFPSARTYAALRAINWVKIIAPDMAESSRILALEAIRKRWR